MEVSFQAPNPSFLPESSRKNSRSGHTQPFFGGRSFSIPAKASYLALCAQRGRQKIPGPCELQKFFALDTLLPQNERMETVKSEGNNHDGHFLHNKAVIYSQLCSETRSVAQNFCNSHGPGIFCRPPESSEAHKAKYDDPLFASKSFRAPQMILHKLTKTSYKNTKKGGRGGPAVLFIVVTPV